LLLYLSLKADNSGNKRRENMFIAQVTKESESVNCRKILPEKLFMKNRIINSSLQNVFLSTLKTVVTIIMLTTIWSQQCFAAETKIASSATAAAAIAPASGDMILISSSDGGLFRAEVGQSSGTYISNGINGYCGTVIAYGDGSSAWVRAGVMGRAYPEWWGGNPDASGASGTDNAPAINAAISSGIKNIFLSKGVWGINSSVKLDQSNIVLEGESMEETCLTSLSTTLSPINAMILVKTQPLNGAIKNMSFIATVSFTGWGISAVYGGTGDSLQRNLFSTEISNVAVYLPSSAAGFFTGGLYDCWINRCRFDGGGYRFKLVGPSSCGNHNIFTDIYDGAGNKPFLETNASNSGITINGVTVIDARGNSSSCNWWADINDAVGFAASNISYSAGDSADLSFYSSGFMRFTDCSRVNVSNSIISRNDQGASAFYGMSISNSSVAISNLSVYQDSYSQLVRPFTIIGSGNQIKMNGVQVVGGTYEQIYFSNTAEGSLVISGSKFTKSRSGIIRGDGSTHPIDITFNGCELINPYWEYTGTGVQAFKLSSSGHITFTSNTIGRDAEGAYEDTSNPTNLFYWYGGGSGTFKNNNIIGFSPAMMYYSTVVQRFDSDFSTGEELLADEGAINLPNRTSGIISVSANDEAGVFLFTSGGTVVQLVGTANMSTTNTDGKLCIFPAGGSTYVQVKNRLGTDALVNVSYKYH
jgi:hypothetical protein